MITRVNTGIGTQRLRNQRVDPPVTGQPADLVGWLGAVQAQEYHFAKWALALRLAGDTTNAEIEHAFDTGRILRTHVMRPTWHFVTPADIGWMLDLTGPRVHRTLASYTRRQGLDTKTLNLAAASFERALGGGHHLTRAELGTRLARARITLDGFQLGLVSMYAELEGVICSGARRGKQFTYALLSERAPATSRLPRDESLAELTRRYFTSHGPATIRDFVWWSGLTTADARRGLEMVGAGAAAEAGLTYWRTSGTESAGSIRRGVHLLPIYDEYLVAYRDRAAVPHGSSTIQSGPSAVTFRHALVSAGQVAGTWHTAVHRTGCSIDVTPSRPLASAEQRGVRAAATRYSRFMTSPLTLSIA
ncbi:MAG: winged helix DNA-binding domain-containing protein [Acidobacteria bacterium]|nr:winged helix DNA-binding domain-containing protein [Acidobacteriota bacterium]